MRHNYKKYYLLLICKPALLITLLASLQSCKKYLEEKPDKKIATPSSLDDLFGIMDNYFTLNARYPSAGEVSADNYYLTDAGWAGASELHRNFYTWQKYDLNLGIDWANPYNNVFYANTMLESLQDMDIPANEPPGAGQVKGTALFIRAYNHYAVAQLFAPAYDRVTAATDLGIPLRLNTEYNELSVRSSVEQTYTSILTDLKNALPLLPLQPVLKYRPSKPAAYGTLARTYLAMQDYESAGLYADSCLRLYDSLMDYSSLNAAATIPFKQFNAEVIYDARTTAPSALSATRAKVDSVLFQSYENDDIRRVIFFKSNSDGSKAFKGNYTGLSNAALFAGVATDEMYLIRGEAAARAGNTAAALKDLNDLLRTRWKKIGGVSTYIDKTAASPVEALGLILTERRKELLYRTHRWTDLRRLNKETAFAVTLIRKLNGQQYELLPNSLRYVLQIDREAIRLSGMSQNP